MSLLKYTLLHTLLIVTLYGTSDELMQMQKDLKQLQKELQTLKKDDLNISLPGQYRINFYSVDNDTASQDQQTAARMRIRQSIDIKFTPKLSSRVRFQLNHTNDSITDATDTKGNGVLIRHAFIQYHPSHSHKLKVGLVPVIEYQDDLLYSKSWGYNPFALEGFSSFNDLKLHYFAANLSEGSESNLTDDQIHYQADLIFSGKTVDLTLSTSLLDMANGTQRGS
ncbi:MAG: hypothetical protein OEW60_05040, partial [Thiovulaceae bacterium]|nr:hypothetical protein [Sulfurimonadaceae bacterium]